MQQARRAYGKRLVLLLWLLVAIFYFYLAWDYIRVTQNDREFGEYVQHVVQISTTQQRSATDVRDLLMEKAHELSLPVQREQIQVKSGRNGFDVMVNYAVDIEIPVLQRQLYTKRFEHKANFQGPQ